MSTALQIALMVAAAAFVALVACLIPVVLRAQRQLDRLVLTVEQVKSDLDVLVDESRELMRNVNSLVERAEGPLQDVEHMVRAERVVSAVGAVIEPPVFALARNAGLFRIGAATLLRILSHRKRRSEASSQTTEENNHG
jgi:hypothetical protein